MKRVFLIVFLSVSFITSVINAQEVNGMYSYKQIDGKYIVSVNTGEEIVKALTKSNPGLSPDWVPSMKWPYAFSIRQLKSMWTRFFVSRWKSLT